MSVLSVLSVLGKVLDSGDVAWWAAVHMLTCCDRVYRECDVLHSCPGPALVSSASFSALAVTAASQYAPNMNCSVTVYSPDGGAVALVFAAFGTQSVYDSACRGVLCASPILWSAFACAAGV